MLDIFLNWFVIAIPFLVTVGATVLTLKLPHERHYWKFVGAAIVVGLGFSGIAYWQQVRSMGQARVDQDKAIRDTADRVAKKTTDNVTEALGNQYGSIIKEMTGQNESLRSQLTEQGKKVDKISGSDIVSGKNPLRVEVTNPQGVSGEPSLSVHTSEMRITPDPSLGHNASQVILTTNKRMNGARMTVVCKDKILRGSFARLAGASTTSGSSALTDDHTMLVDISSPDWSPEYPLIVTLYYEADNMGVCNFTLR